MIITREEGTVFNCIEIVLDMTYDVYGRFVHYLMYYDLRYMAFLWVDLKTWMHSLGILLDLMHWNRASGICAYLFRGVKAVWQISVSPTFVQWLIWIILPCHMATLSTADIEGMHTRHWRQVAFPMKVRLSLTFFVFYWYNLK